MQGEWFDLPPLRDFIASVAKPWTPAPCVDCGRPRAYQPDSERKHPSTTRCAECGQKARVKTGLRGPYTPRSPCPQCGYSLRRKGGKYVRRHCGRCGWQSPAKRESLPASMRAAWSSAEYREKMRQRDIARLEKMGIYRNGVPVCKDCKEPKPVSKSARLCVDCQQARMHRHP